MHRGALSNTAPTPKILGQPTDNLSKWQNVFAIILDYLDQNIPAQDGDIVVQASNPRPESEPR
jgi:hypothetical protein